MDVANLGMSSDQITTAILAGGLGTRLRSVVADTPKVLAMVRGRPFLSYLLDVLVERDLKNVVLCTGYLGEQIQGAFGDTYRGLRLNYSQEAEPLGTAGALRLAAPFLQSDVVLVMNGDSYYQTDLSLFLSCHRNRCSDATLLLAAVPDSERYGSVVLDQHDHIVRFKEKSDDKGDSSDERCWINAGMYLFSQRMLSDIVSSGAESLEREVFPAWVGETLHGCRSQGDFLDVGTPESYRAAEQFFARYVPDRGLSLKNESAQ